MLLAKNKKVKRIPTNNSISINLDSLVTTTSVEFDEKLEDDEVTLNGAKLAKNHSKRISEHLNKIRNLANFQTYARVVSENSFPTSAGMASSASGFAALTVAALEAAEVHLSQQEISSLARIGSGSACRSIPDGFVEWIAGQDAASSYAISLYPPEYWDIRILSIQVEADEKEISSTEGMKLAPTSPFFKTRLQNLSERITRIKKALAEKDFKTFGEIAEDDALEFHKITQTSTPSIMYWNEHTIELMELVKKLRKRGVDCYFTIDAGPHVHVLCLPAHVSEIQKAVENLSGIEKIFISKPAVGARLM